MDQTFNGPVGQVAGGSINNYGPVTWDDLPTEELHIQRQRYKALLWAARRRLFFNVPNLVLAITLPGTAAYALYMLSLMGTGMLGTTASQIPGWAIFGYAILCIGLPAHLSLKAREREGAIIYDCQAHLRGIDIALNRRR